MPFVSCVMPTYNRRAFLPNAIKYFLRQNYPDKELIIIDDGSDAVGDLVPNIPSIKYFRLENKITLGEKLNIACGYAKGQLIANWDDDDWYADWRLSYQVSVLKNTGSDLCGINKLLYYDLNSKNAYQYIYPSEQRVWMLGSSLCYTMDLWKKNHFADIDVGMDGLFVRNTDTQKVTVLDDHRFSVHMIHGNNISPKKTSGKWWDNYSVSEIQKLIGPDWSAYNTNSNGYMNYEKLNGHKVQGMEVGLFKALSFKNIYACLVHEKEDCIIDLVKNLHHNDPSSVILIYNGGDNPGLVSKDFPFDKFGAVVHPNPRPMQHGYLHNFALDCMEFALNSFSFDALTIVDSDQLSIRTGYTEYIAQYFSKLNNIGMLSSCPERITKDIQTNFVTSQAFKEYELWKPFLLNFSDGEEKFAHWTFWPSTVFSYDAIRDIVKIFKQNKQLQEIMLQTKIWATEEVIFPTLVRLLGYEIAANPCSYDYVSYRKLMLPEDAKQAKQKAEAYWMHPVERNYDDPVRKLIRDQSDQYFKVNATDISAQNTRPFHISVLINSIRNIKGWLSDKEAELLISITLQACSTLQAPQNIVEVGSYHGKSTVIFGSIIRQLFPLAKLFAIDIHDGKLGAEDQGLQSFLPSFEIIKKNIKDFGLSTVVEIIKDKSFNVKWGLPISFLFIDGLHDYKNVKTDFENFSKWIVPGGLVAFHDYSDYWPGVKEFVDELLESGKYIKVQKEETLTFLKREY